MGLECSTDIGVLEPAVPYLSGLPVMRGIKKKALVAASKERFGLPVGDTNLSYPNPR